MTPGLTAEGPPPAVVHPAPPELPPSGVRRRLGHYDRGLPGPTVVIVGGMHGNEPSGVIAIQRVLGWLGEYRPPFRGRFVGLAGNLPALEAGQRFLDEDLNRIFLPGRVEQVGAPDWAPASSEQGQQHELLKELAEVFPVRGNGVFFLDLHTSSARGEPFVCIGDTLRNRRFALQFPVPVILGLEEQVDGALLEHVNNLGYVTVGVEAGQHDHPDSADHHEAFVALALVASGCLDEADLPHAAVLRARLERAAGHLPPLLEVRYRHAIEPGDQFLMDPGYANFQPVAEDESLARDRSGDIRSPFSGRMLLPLYQGLGNDGFFLVREIRPFWLGVSAWLRWLRLDRFAPLLPGVRRSRTEPRTLLVDTRVARFFPVQIFHLLGFRKRRARGGQLVFSRREE